MKILMVFHSPLYPPESGVIKRNFHIFLEAAHRNEVSVITYGEQDEIAFRREYGHLCKELIFVSVKKSPWRTRFLTLLYLMTGRSEARQLHVRRIQSAIDRLMREQRFDLVHLSTPFLLYHRFPARTRLVSDAHNVEYDNVQRAYRAAENIARKVFYFLVYITIRRDEVRNLRKCELIMATSERDAALFRLKLPEKRFVVVPNGVDVETFSPVAAEPDPYTVVFTGLMEYYPNEHGVLYFLEKVFPLILTKVPHARFCIVGANPSARVTRWASPQVEVTGYVKDVRPYFTRAQVAVIPLWIGGGTRLKALEAVAMKKPIVSTTVGCEGINFTDGEDVLFADTPEAFAGSVVRLFHDSKLRSSIADTAYQKLLPEYRWEAVGKKLDTAYRQAVHQSAVDHH